MPSRNYAMASDVTPIIREILADDRWYRDGPPQWLESRGKPWERPCETARHARDRREAAIRKLGRARSVGLDAGKLGERLESCATYHRCCSGACPECLRATQRAFVAHSQSALASIKISEPPILVSMVPDFGGLPLGSSARSTWDSIELRVRKALHGAGISIAMLGADFSVNSRRDDKFIQGQFWGLICNPPKPWKNHLKPLINASKSISRPIRAEGFDGDPAGLAYALKTKFSVKTWVRDLNLSRDDRGPSSNTRNRWLQGGADWLQLMLFLDEIGLDSRMVLIGIKRISTKKGVTFQVLQKGGENQPIQQ